jgi:hypothetical protein
VLLETKDRSVYSSLKAVCCVVFFTSSTTASDAVDVECVDQNEWTGNHTDVLDQPHCSYSFCIGLHWASHNGHSKVVGLLLESGVRSATEPFQIILLRCDSMDGSN